MKELKVGAVARSTGLTVRTLHHYDEIGLVKPSARSAGGYRLYTPDDVARLNAVQALRQLGFGLAAVQDLLTGEGASSPEQILRDRTGEIERQLQEITRLQDRLDLLRHSWIGWHSGRPNGWVECLSVIEVFVRYFSMGELKALGDQWRRVEARWWSLRRELETFVEAGGDPASPAGRVLGERLLAFMLEWMEDDRALVDRWLAMYDQEPSLHGWAAAPSHAALKFLLLAVPAAGARPHSTP